MIGPEEASVGAFRCFPLPLHGPKLAEAEKASLRDPGDQRLGVSRHHRIRPGLSTRDVEDTLAGPRRGGDGVEEVSQESTGTATAAA